MDDSDDNFCDNLSEQSTSTASNSLSNEDEDPECWDEGSGANIIPQLFNREIYGRFTKNYRGKTDKIFREIQQGCRFSLSSMIPEDCRLNHVFLGFTLCGTYFLSYTQTSLNNSHEMFFNSPYAYEYELHLWRFQPGTRLKYITKYRLFRQSQDYFGVIDNVKVMQFPLDPHKLICYGVIALNTPMAFLTILTLPSNYCKHCRSPSSKFEDALSEAFCIKHGFILHYTFPLSNPSPIFDPNISLAYPDHLVINTGHYIHILHFKTANPPLNNFLSTIKEEFKTGFNFNDTQSETSETISDHFDTSSMVESIPEDFNEYDLENGDCNKPFHELNISCEPLNVTGKSYHNTLVQNIVDPRMKRLQTTKDYQFSVPQSSAVQKNVAEKPKIDPKKADKAYEFIEENEKCEKLSLFRKKRLAEKKYEFSEDNSENIVPFNSLRRERRFFRRCIRSPDFNSLFLSPKSPGIRSPMQSPSSRNGQFSPSGSNGRTVYCTSFRNSPLYCSRSPISPKESARKFQVYSPLGTDSDTELDSKLIMKTSSGQLTGFGSAAWWSTGESSRSSSCGLLIVDLASRDTPKWIKKVVRRYSNGDFENGSLLSGQSRDDCNIPIEIPLIAQTQSDQILDIVPDFKIDHITQMQLIVTQRTFDCEQFIQKQAQQLCADSQMQFLHCSDYDIKVIYVCPLEGHIICRATIKIGVLRNVSSSNCQPAKYCSEIMFSWNIETDEFKLITTSSEKFGLRRDHKQILPFQFPKVNQRKVLVLDFDLEKPKTVLRDYSCNYEIYLNDKWCCENYSLPFMYEFEY